MKTKSILLLCAFMLPLLLMSQSPTVHWGGYLIDGTDVMVSEMKLDAQGNAITVGSFLGQGDFDGGPGTVTGTSNGDSDAFVMKTDTAGNLLWVKFLGGTGHDEARGLSLDALGNCYVMGTFESTVDFDPGAATYNITELGSGGDAFLLKLSSQGSFSWVKRLGSASWDSGRDVVVDGNGNCIVVGEFSGTCDFDPGGGVFNLTPASYAGYVCKLDNTGAFVWAEQFGLGNASLTVDASNNIFVAGKFDGNMDMDPGPGTTFLQSGTFSMGFINKLDANGSLLWAKEFGDTSATTILDMETDTAGNVVAVGYFLGRDDFDPGAGVFPLTSSGFLDPVVLNLDVMGNLRWVSQISGPGDDFATDIAFDHVGNIYVSGVIGSECDFDPGIGSYFLGASNDGITFIEKLTPMGNLAWAISFGTAANFTGGYMCLGINDSLQIVSTGGFLGSFDILLGLGINFLPGSSYGAFFMRFDQDSCSSVVTYADSNQAMDCQNPNGFISLTSTGGTPPYNYVWNTIPAVTDSFLAFTSPGIYIATMTDALGCERSNTFYINAPTSLNAYDLQVDLLAQSPIVGQDSWMWLDGFNDGCMPIVGTVFLVLDPWATFIQSNPTPSAVHGDTVFWNASSLVYAGLHFMAMLQIQTDSTAILGDTMCFTLAINPFSGDFDTLNNLRSYCMEVRASFDPNLKQAYPVGACAEHFVHRNELLTYTVQFQNTGTSEAYQVEIFDTISPSLDLNSLRIVASSHPVQMELLPGRVLRFVFADIHLPDSTTNEPASHGYVIYEVSPHPNVVDGTVVYNSAAIVFDFNAPVVTNLVHHTLVNVIPTCPLVMNEATTNVSISVYPNPNSGHFTVLASQPIHQVKLINAIGQAVLMRPCADLTMLDFHVEMLPKGLYFLEIEAGDGKFFQRLVLE